MRWSTRRFSSVPTWMHPMPADVVVLRPNDSVAWAAEIASCWRRGVEAIIETGRAIAAAKAALAHGEFVAMCERALPFSARTAQRLMAIAEDGRLTDPTLASHLPPSWDTLYVLTRLDDVAFQARLSDGTINPDMRRTEVMNGLTETRRQGRLAEMRELGVAPIALPAGPFCAAIADPPWENSDAPIGFSDRHYRNKYATMTPAEVAALPVASMLAGTACMALWITRHHLAIGSHLPVLAAWGLNPNTVATWDKEWIGLGNGFFRDRTEHIVLATRGDVPAPPPALRPDSLYSERRSGKHSEKPEAWLHQQIEAWFPGMAYVELFARRARPGWVAWGNQTQDVSSFTTDESVEKIDMPPAAPLPREQWNASLRANIAAGEDVIRRANSTL